MSLSPSRRGSSQAAAVVCASVYTANKCTGLTRSALEAHASCPASHVRALAALTTSVTSFLVWIRIALRKALPERI